MGSRRDILNELFKRMNENEEPYKKARQEIEQEANQKLNLSLATLHGSVARLKKAAECCKIAAVIKF